MTTEVLSELMDFGALGIFAGFLIWQHLGMQKRMDCTNAKFMATLDKINDDYDSCIEVMRERYYKVIQSIRDDATTAQRDFVKLRESVRESVVEQLTENSRKIDSLLTQIESNHSKIDTDLTEIKTSVQTGNQFKK
jgi:hypothetical protein